MITIYYEHLWTIYIYISYYIIILYYIICWSMYDIYIYIASTHTDIYIYIINDSFIFFITIKYLALAIVFHVSFQVFSCAVAWNFSPCCARTLHTAVPWDVFVGREMSKITMFKWENQGKHGISWKWSTHMEKHGKSTINSQSHLQICEIQPSIQWKESGDEQRQREREGKIS